ncbi:multidrug effflux MFS transporter [Beggiatoa leptomitoformis]|uniref:Bcr/CflA family efflux transporter n=1 Tax=Beggiatoa leptomitoformis TaxID=288004 RepID=A0A2N9YJ89_9GAMM|nr:multidrug effflux MFS transporter [Beggiatoa leptomitoformis]ALG69506.1 Bcr/CflA family efflux MFS transporter [Beggiatoa leptomitoformis]AUI70591.1 Bcr/CflA family efflux MFS transporter [Beggiatoa leptomitoformis]
MRNPQSLTIAMILAACVALGPLSTDMYLPSLPMLVTVFSTSIDQVQLTLSIFLVGFAVGQLVYGPLADRFGRKPVMLGGMVIFTAATVGCIFVQSIDGLIILRFLQALGGCVGPVLGRTVVRDIYGAVKAAKVLSYIATAMAVAPAIAPILGGYLTTWFDWHSVFVFLSLYGVLMIVTILFYVPETRPDNSQAVLNPFIMFRNYRVLVMNRRYNGYVLCCSFAYGGLFAFISGSAFVLIDFLGVEKQHFGYFFMVIIAGYMTGTIVSGKFSLQLGVNRLVLIGAVVMCGAGFIMVSAAGLGIYNVWIVILPMMFFSAGGGIVMPQAMAGALAPFPEMTGTASALFGFTQSMMAAVMGMVVGHLHTGTTLVMACCVAIMGFASLISYFGLVQRRVIVS